MYQVSRSGVKIKTIRYCCQVCSWTEEVNILDKMDIVSKALLEREET